MWAIWKSNERIAQLLIEGGADPNVYNFTGETVIMEVSRDSNAEIAQLLPEKADLSAQDRVEDHSPQPLQDISFNDKKEEQQLESTELVAMHSMEINNQSTEIPSTHNYDYIGRVEAIYHNPLLNHKELFNKAYKFAGMKAINSILELGKDKDIAEQILLTVDEVGTEKVLDILFNPVKSIDLQATQTADNKIQETITKIEDIIGKGALSEVTSYYKYVSATKIIQIVSSLVNNLDECLDFGIAYENIDIDNQVTIILSQLEHWFGFVASGQMHIGLPPRYLGFDPSDDYNGGSGGGGKSLIYGGGIDNEHDEYPVTFFVGYNTTSTFES